MNYLTRRLTDFSQVESLYKSRLVKDFAEDERKPLSSMKESWEKGTYDCYGLFDDEKIVGYAFFVRNGKYCLLDYFAIKEDRRNEGLGSIFLKQLSLNMEEERCVIVEVEDPDQANSFDDKTLRNRRLQFYLRNGYSETTLKSSVFGVAYRLLEASNGVPHAAGDICAAYTDIYRSTLPDRFFQTQFAVSEKKTKTKETEYENRSNL